MLNIKITGASGYLGQMITKELRERGHKVDGISRELLYGSTKLLKNEIIGSDVIINLAGAGIFRRWSLHNREEIYNSRVHTSRNLVAAIKKLPPEGRPKKLISASAIGIYKNGYSHDETSLNFAEDFVGNVTRDWEDALNDLPGSTQKIVFRIGLVLGKDAKTIKNLKLPFRFGLGAKIGKGDQPFPFVHVFDVVESFSRAVESDMPGGVFNLVAPEKITNSEFTRAFAKILKRPSFFAIPSIVLKLALGPRAVLLLENPEVSPVALLETGFKFSYPDIEAALSEILK